MKRRDFLRQSSAALAATALSSCDTRARWTDLRLVLGSRASEIERAACEDARSLLARAIGTPPPIVDEGSGFGRCDVLVGTAESAEAITGARVPQTAGGFRLRSGGTPMVVVDGYDAEGARNGLYALLESLEFGFFRDGVVAPRLSGTASIGVDLVEQPSFRWRGDMIWDNYLGPRRYCASVWHESDWERALTYMARNRMNFLEFYPPLEHVLARVFPEARGLDDGSVWKAEVKHALAKKVLARARALGIHCMYVLSYGSFPEPIRALYPNLQWLNGFLCAHQPELRELTRKTWTALIDELGTDHWYAIRHRGEEEQVYSDPCRSVTKAQGFLQAFAVMKDVDPEARMTVWTWGERIPDLFETFPEDVHAVHIRHGMADVFADVSSGREQSDGGPDLPAARRWLSGQFTVFGGNETLLRTAWSDAAALARDAAASADDPACEGYFQWPEWSDTSVWLSDVIAKLSWAPDSIDDVERALADFAHVRHDVHATPFLEAYLPLVRAGNARFMHPPRKRLMSPYELSAESLELVADVRRGAGPLIDALGGHRDVVDLVTWVAVRQAHALEADAYLRHVGGEAASESLDAALSTWTELGALLAQFPELSIVGAARAARDVGELSGRVEDSFWTLGCDFYRGYPLVLSPEAIELVYVEQTRGLARAMENAELAGEVAALESPGWFWHDFPDPAWAASVRKLPSEDAARLERTVRQRIREAFEADPAPVPSVDMGPARRLLEIDLPEALHQPPLLPS